VIELAFVLDGSGGLRRIDMHPTDRVSVEFCSRANPHGCGRLLSLARLQVRFRRRYELVHASGRAKIVAVAFVLSFAAGLRRIDGHAADGIFRGNIYDPVLLASLGFAHPLPFPISPIVLFTSAVMLYIECGISPGR